MTAGRGDGTVGRGVPIPLVLGLELRKLVRSVPAIFASIGTVLLVLATTAGGYALSQQGGDSPTAAKTAVLVAVPGWSGFTALGAMSLGVTMLLAGGVVASWSIGREFTDGTVVGLFALPVSPARICAAKLHALALWALGLCVVSAVLTTLAGLALGLPLLGAADSCVVLVAVGALVSLSAAPVAWVTTIGHGYLAGITTTLALVVISNLLAGFDLGSLVPWSIPVLWATPGSGTSATALLAPLGTAAIGALGTWRAWARLQLGRR